MAQKILNKPKLTIHHAEIAGHIKNKDSVARLNYIAKSIAASCADLNCCYWTRENYLDRLNRLNERLSVTLISAESDDISRGFSVKFADGDSVPIEELDSYFSSLSGPFTICIVTTDFPIDLANLLEGHTAGLSSYLVFDKSDVDLAVATACEISNWWNFQSLITREFAYSDYLKAIEHLAKVVSSSANTRINFVKSPNQSPILWEGGLNFTSGVDIDKIQNNNRIEQISDTLKRMCDLENLPLFLHSEPSEKLAISQARFWFCEIGDRYISDWVSALTFASRYRIDSIQSNVASHYQILPKEFNEEIVFEFFNSFRHVEAGEYRLGTDKDDKESEPPAPDIEFYAPGFSVLDRPVTFGDWSIFAEKPDAWTQHISNPSMPVNYISAIEAMLFASIVDNALRRAGLISQSEEVRLPSEFEWEVAARGPNAFEYPWGNEFVEGNCNCDLIIGTTPSAIGEYSPKGDSFVGCKDMSGNVREWTCTHAGIKGLDWAHYSAEPRLKSTLTIGLHDRLIVRGGSYSYNSYCVRSWVRNTNLAKIADKQTGFRLCIGHRVAGT